MSDVTQMNFLQVHRSKGQLVEPQAQQFNNRKSFCDAQMTYDNTIESKTIDLW